MSEKGVGTLAKNGGKILKSKPVSFIAKKGASQLGTESVLNVVVAELASNFGVGMDKVSVFKPALDRYKSGLITIEQLMEKNKEIAKLTGKNQKYWLGLLSSRFKEPIADFVLGELTKY